MLKKITQLLMGKYLQYQDNNIIQTNMKRKINFCIFVKTKQNR